MKKPRGARKVGVKEASCLSLSWCVRARPWVGGCQSELGTRPTGRPEEVACNMGSAAWGGAGHPALPSTAGVAKLMERVDQGGETEHGLGIGPGHWA